MNDYLFLVISLMYKTDIKSIENSEYNAKVRLSINRDKLHDLNKYKQPLDLEPTYSYSNST